MKVEIAETMGICDGVRRALAMATEEAKRHGRLQTDGPVVHNPQAVRELARYGVVVSPDLEFDIPILVRAHGVPPEKLAAWRRRGLPIIDATCPKVAANQRLVADAAERGDTVLFAGDPDHAETRAVAGSAGSRCHVVTSVEDIGKIARETPRDEPVFLLAQTTFGLDLFQAIRDAASRRWPNLRCAESICPATRQRQEAAGRLADMVDAVVVVGGRESANTRRLADVVRRRGKPVFQMETADDIPFVDLHSFDTVGVTAGASTPDWVTNEVIRQLRNFDDKGNS